MFAKTALLALQQSIDDTMLQLGGSDAGSAQTSTSASGLIIRGTIISTSILELVANL